MSTTIRVSEDTRDRLAALSRATGRPMSQMVDEALDALDRRTFFDQLNERFAELREEEEAWASIEDERRLESGSLGDRST